MSPQPVEVVREAPVCILGEGPFWDARKAVLYYVDIAGRTLHRFDPISCAGRSWTFDKPISAVIPTAGDDLIVALSDGLFRFDPELQTTELFARPDVDPSNRSNECRCDPQGRIWLGTMQNNLGPAGEPVPVTRASGGLFCVDDAARSRRMLSDIGIANTLAWSPDGSRLYFADSRRNLIWRFSYDPEGPVLRDREIFVEGGPGVPDGSAMDSEGFLWTARWGAGCVIRYAPDGRAAEVVETPARQPSSCAFGGEDLRTLFVTTARHGLEPAVGDHDGRLLSLQVTRPGLPLQIFKG